MYVEADSVFMDSRTGTIRHSRLGRKRRLLALTFLIATAMLAGAISPGLVKQMGGRLSGEPLSRARGSIHFSDGKFRNSEHDRETTPAESLRQLTHGLFGKEERIPTGEIPVVSRHASDYANQPDSGLRLTWVGHASVLIEMDGRRILIDPVWSERASPLASVGPKRFHGVPISLAELPMIDVVVISHDHYDHLDMATVQVLASRGVRFVVPLGVGAHLEAWGVPPNQFDELDWGEQVDVAGLKLIATPARHYSGRSPLRMRETLWASWVVQGTSHRIFYSGDTGYSKAFQSIGDKYGPFDFTLMKIGGSDPSWADIHMTPEEAVRAHLDLRGRVLFPVHWGTFNVAFHAWKEPPEQAVAAAKSMGAILVVPRPGQSVEPNQLPPVDYWWRYVK